MFALLISILISMGVIATEADYYDLSEAEQEQYEQAIINEDLGSL